MSTVAKVMTIAFSVYALIAIIFLISNSAVSGELWADAGWHPSA